MLCVKIQMVNFECVLPFYEYCVSGEIREKKPTETATSVPLHVVSRGLFN